MKRLFFLAVLASPAILAQAPEDPVVLTIDVENTVLYRGNVFDASKLAKDPGLTTSVNAAFMNNIAVGDIVAVDGKPAKGLWTTVNYAMPYRRVPQPGQPIADFDIGGTTYCTWIVYSPDGTLVGMITDVGLAAGVDGHTLTGGVGFSGVVGEHRFLPGGTASRQASTAEDPANRRSLGGGKSSAVFYLYPRVRPAVQVTASGPSVFHTDYSPVTATKPARPGEFLILAATGLGPVRPNLLPPGAVEFSGSPFQDVNAPVTVMFNDKELPVINKSAGPARRLCTGSIFRCPPTPLRGRRRFN